MDSIYFTKPILLLIPLIILILHVLAWKLKSPLWLTAVNAAVHAVGISLILLQGGDMTDALVLVLVSGFAALLLSPLPKKNEKAGEDK